MPSGLPHRPCPLARGVLDQAPTGGGVADSLAMETGWDLTALVEAIRAGDVVIKPGHSLPILRDATTRRP